MNTLKVFKKNFGSIKKIIITSLFTTGFITGCATQTSVKYPDYSSGVQTVRVPETPRGSVEYVWEEPMIDVIDVPPGLDPEGHYYRRGHQSIVEIRQGRWQYYKEKN